MSVWEEEPNAWVEQIFEARTAKNGGIVRRSVSSVKKYASESQLKCAVKRRGFHLVRSNSQYLIYCHTGHIQLIC